MNGKPQKFFWVVVGLVVAILLYIGINRFNKKHVPGNSGSSSAQSQPNQSDSEILDITIYSSSAKKAWIDSMVKKFNSDQNEVDDRIVRVTAIHVQSGESFDDLKAGKIKPDIWSPGDESWLQMAAAYWKEYKQKELFSGQTPLVKIPLVIAMWEPMAKALGYPNPIGWKDVAKVASNPNGWAAYGHSEWGRFRWGHAHPDANSGFLTVISEVYAALEKTNGITVQDLKKPQLISFLEVFEGAVEHYGLSNSWIDELMHQKGPSYLSATVQYENTIIESNDKYDNKPFKLVAIYPTEGCFWTRHPAVILDEEWMTPSKKEACGKFISFLVSDEAQTQAMKMGIRPISENISMSVPFDESHGVELNVSDANAFTVPDPDILKRIHSLWESVKVPATVILILDQSGSMSGLPMDNAKSGAVSFIKSMKARDQLMVVIFNHQINQLSELCFVKECGEDNIRKLQGVFAGGETAVYDTVHRYYQVLKDLKKKEPNRRYGILLLSDGKDTASKIERYDFIDTLPSGEDFDAPKIFTIAYGPEADIDLLTTLSRRTNARVFNSSPEEIIRTYKELSANF